MTRRIALVAAPLAAALLSAGCAGGTVSDAYWECNRFVDLIDDVENGEVPDFATFQERLNEIGEFRRGSILRESYDRLREDIERGDEASASDETEYLYDNCVQVMDQ